MFCNGIIRPKFDFRDHIDKIIGLKGLSVLITKTIFRFFASAILIPYFTVLPLPYIDKIMWHFVYMNI